MASPEMDSTGSVRKHFVKLVTGELVNSSVDSVYVDNSEADIIELTALLTTNGTMESTPVSLYDGEKLIAKTAAIFDTDKKAEVKFTIPANQQIKGKVEITDVGLPYDNQLYVTIDQRDKIKVLAIDSGNNRYLKRIFTDTEFDFSQFDIQNLDYAKLGEQNLIILGELESIPNSLTTSLNSYADSGGNLTVIPAENITLESYNTLLANLFGSSITQKVNVERNITKIAFSHPLYQNVFEKNVTNFQYPRVSNYFRIKSSLPTALSFQDNDPFLVGTNGKYLFTASINGQNSNFKESPLIVPTFYNMGINSLKLPALYQLIGGNATIDIPITLSKDGILKVTAEGFEFIPRQQIRANKVSLTFQDNEIPDGIYGITDDEKIIKNISFNYPRDESQLNYMDLNGMNPASVQSSVTSLFDSIQKDNSINALWKWFVILALLFLVVEIIIQKYL
ncbi:hypothetical protein [Maribacter halichondriae]|uniref:hypothetical protein n=1 Tax=Maribacter halichondriae TaxID=2980554 RepID=UPI002359DC9E|nr:hypothetical protein [Maribacter sp. Hal144]